MKNSFKVKIVLWHSEMVNLLARNADNEDFAFYIPYLAIKF